MYTSNREYKNRYGDKYEFVGTDSPSRFILEGDILLPMRMGGKEGVEVVNRLDLGMIDPSGGPYIDLSTLLDNKKITKISVYSEVIMLETEE
jgi:hypothetical protein